MGLPGDGFSYDLPTEIRLPCRERVGPSHLGLEINLSSALREAQQGVHNDAGVCRMRDLHSMIRVGDLDAALDFVVGKLGMVQMRRRDDEKGRFSLIFLAAPEDLDAAKGRE